MAANARGAAFRDPRFPALTRDEWPQCTVEVSLLPAPPIQLRRRGATCCRSVRAGEDGLILEADGTRATFLPQVWEGLPDKRAFLAELERKAGLPADTSARAVPHLALRSGEDSMEALSGRWWHMLDDGRMQCDLCPRDCRLHEGQRGLCFVRKREGDRMVLTTYGRSSGFCIDPVEKKPLNHFYPGTSILSFGTAGCNLACKFCQNWDITKSREMDRLHGRRRRPEAIARGRARARLQVVAFTYNDPVIFAEYAMDIADACHAQGVQTVAVTAGYIHAAPRREFYAKMDAANVDLKAFTEEFYFKVCGAQAAAGARYARLPACTRPTCGSRSRRC